MRPSQAVATRVREARNSASLSQAELARRMAELGFSGWVRETGTQIESGKRRIQIDELLGLAWVLRVAPIHLLVPFEERTPKRLNEDEMIYRGERLEIGEGVTMEPTEARAWIRGDSLRDTGPNTMRDWLRYYVEEIPHPERSKLRLDAGEARKLLRGTDSIEERGLPAAITLLIEDADRGE